MSGEAGGLLLIGAVVGLTPIVLGTLAVAGLAYGAVAAGGYLAKEAENHARQKEREKELYINNCSSQLDGLYESMRRAAAEQRQAHAESARRLSEQYRAMGERLEELQTTHPDLTALNRSIEEGQRQIRTESESAVRNLRQEVRTTAERQMKTSLDALDRSHQTMADMKHWAETTAAARALQKAQAEEMLRDARASREVLAGMAKNTTDETFLSQARSMDRALEAAENFFRQEMYQAAFGNARKVIRTCASLAGEHVRQEMEADAVAMALRSRLLALGEEMKKRRAVRWQDTQTVGSPQRREDLNSYSQGKYAAMQREIQRRLDWLDTNAGRAASAEELERQLDDFDRELEPEARRVMERAQEVLTGYTQRVQALEVIADFMQKQDYQMSWVMPEGGDKSQKLVLNFTQQTTGNSVSVTLDSDAQDAARMAMEVLTFYGNGRPVTEAEKKQLRDHLTGALNQAGFAGSLACQDCWNASSPRVELADKAKVRSAPVRQVV